MPAVGKEPMAEFPGSGGPLQPAGGDSSAYSQAFKHESVSARVPERIVRGVFSTGALVLEGPNEFIIDFLQGLTRPYQVAARIVLAPAVMGQLVVAVRDNIENYSKRFGPPPTMPKPPTDRRPTIQEIYDEFKVSDEVATGAYANAVMVGHSPGEFFFDFITRFYPQAAVSARVFVAAAQVTRVMETLDKAWTQHLKRLENPPPTQPPPPPREP